MLRVERTNTTPLLARGEVIVDACSFTLAAVTVAYALLLAPLGHYLLDEGIYDMMARAFTTRGALSVWNGYEELPASALTLRFLVPGDGVLYPQYPPGLAIAGYPFYLFLDARGLVVLNAVAFCLALGLTRATVRELTADDTLAAASALGFGAGTFAWTYAVGMWPHMTALTGVLASVYLALRAGGRRSDFLAFLSGLTLGAGMLFRLDAVLALPGVLVLCLSSDGRRFRLVAAALFGLTPALLFLALVNFAKFGVISPLSYGISAGYMDLSRYVPIMIGTLAVGIGGVALSCARTRAAIVAHPVWAIVVLVVAMVVALALPWTGAFIRRLTIGLYRLLVDLRDYDPSILGLREYRTDSGALFYARSMKKALLQSCPYFVLCLIPVVLFARRSIAPIRVLAIAVVAAGFIVPFAYLSWHGGRSLNMCYFLPALPFLVILSFLGFQTLVVEIDNSVRASAIVGAVTGLFAALAAIVIATTAPLPLHERLIGEIPLLLAGVVAITAALVWLGPASWRRASGTALSAAFAAALAWSTAIGLLYDGLRDQLMRRTNERIGSEAANLLAPDSLLVTIYPDPFFVLHTNRVRLANPDDDAPDSVRRLIDFNLDAGRKVYVVVTDEALEKLRREGVLNGIELTDIPSELPLIFREAHRS